MRSLNPASLRINQRERCRREQEWTRWWVYDQNDKGDKDQREDEIEDPCNNIRLFISLVAGALVVQGSN